MKVFYPASHQISKLGDAPLALKIARHSPCSACDSCFGLRPPPNVHVALDEIQAESSLGGLDQYGSDDDDIAPYLTSCICGHSIQEHGADETEIGRDEFVRRARVAIRLDEFLQDEGKLLDFSYVNEDIISLRLQMKLRSSEASPETNLIAISEQHSSPTLALSPASSILSDEPPPAKKRRVSTSSLSDADEDDEEDQPLATRMALMSSERPEKSTRVAPGQRSGKKVSGKGQTAPTSLPPPTGQEQALMNGEVNGFTSHEGKVKVEDRMDESQLSRLVTGVTVDASGAASSTPASKPEKAAFVELRKGVIQVTPVENDGQPRSLVILTGLKTLFQKQLPKMPREYIARLVYDNNSKSLGIIKRGYKVVGGICYRPFPHRGFAEIAFFATTSVDQEKGYGGMLMDQFKAHIKKTYPDMMHFLTYADNYAVGYFKKQGFSKEITLDRSIWAGYIKDYEGGTIMQCTMLRKFDYLDKTNILAQQREAILAKMREKSRSHVVYPGLPQFRNGRLDVTVSPKDVPGLSESGWTPAMTPTTARTAPKGADHNFMERLLSDLQNHPQGWPFLQPVNGDEVADYYEVIKRPMDFRTMEHKLETNQYQSLESFAEDAQLVFDNCRIYNPEGSIYAKNATKLEKYVKEQLADRVLKRQD